MLIGVVNRTTDEDTADRELFVRGEFAWGQLQVQRSRIANESHVTFELGYLLSAGFSWCSLPSPKALSSTSFVGWNASTKPASHRICPRRLSGKLVPTWL